ncbi:hypothetical protein F5Y08DRAFT_347836 [Xylaria arbuscula]|nr:hypothetical protein F5Y08DRAFT_347836 [Xylaria arbuscula]
MRRQRLSFWVPLFLKILERVGAVAMTGVRFMVGEGEGRGEVVDEVGEGGEEGKGKGERLTSIVHRGKYVEGLLAEIPGDRVHVSKKLASVERRRKRGNEGENVGEGKGKGEGEGPITLHFTDGSTYECDILVGADGIHSTAREFILGPDDPAAKPRNTGLWLVMTLQPYAKAREIMDREFVDARDPREYSWVGQGTYGKGSKEKEGKRGNGSYILHNVLRDAEVVQFVVGSSDSVDEAGDRWMRSVAREEMRDLYRGWTENLRNAVEEFLCQQPEHTAFYLWEHPQRVHTSRDRSASSATQRTRRRLSRGPAAGWLSRIC